MGFTEEQKSTAESACEVIVTALRNAAEALLAAGLPPDAMASIIAHTAMKHSWRLASTAARDSGREPDPSLFIDAATRCAVGRKLIWREVPSFKETPND